MRKYVFSFLRYFVFYFLGFVAFFLFDYLLTVLNEYFAGYLPAVFKSFNPITSREEFKHQEEVIAVLASVASIMLTNLLAVRTDNSKYEYMISKTEGFYRIKDGAKIYSEKFLRADIVSALTVPCMTYALTLIRIPNNAPKFLKILENVLDILIRIPASFEAIFSFAIGAVLITFVSLAARIPAIYLSLAYWRASWLTGAERQG